MERLRGMRCGQSWHVSECQPDFRVIDDVGASVVRFMLDRTSRIWRRICERCMRTVGHCKCCVVRCLIRGGQAPCIAVVIYMAAGN